MPRSRSRPRRLSWAVAAATLLAAALAPAAAQASPQALIRDCLDNGRIVGHYSQQDFSQALANLPTDVAEYSDCAGVIRRAQLAAAATSGGGGGGGAGSVSPRSATIPAPTAASAAAAANPRADPLSFAAPAERAALVHARQAGASSIDVGGQLIRPGVVAARTTSILNALPTPLLIALGALALVALAALGRYARDLVRTRRTG